MSCRLLSLRFVAGLALIASLLVPAPLGASRLIDNLNAGQRQTVVLYGTSETQFGRWADTTPGHGGLSDWLQGLYPGRATVINSGMSGKASRTGLLNVATKVNAHHPDTVIIEFAMNDAYTNYKETDYDRNVSLAEAKSNLNAIIDSILAANPGAEIVLQTMNPAFDTGHHLSGTQRPRLNDYYQAYRDVAAKRGLLLVDHYPNWTKLQTSDPAGAATAIPDGLHPTAPASLAVTLPCLEAQLLAPTLSVSSKGAATSVSATSAVSEETVAALPANIRADDPALRYVGRFDHADPAGPRCAWSASAVKFRFEGAALNVRMKSTGADFWEVYLDGRAVSTLELRPENELHAVVRNPGPGVHEIELVKRTEFHVGTTQILGFQSDAGGRLFPAEPVMRRIEVIGDSISCGYGNEAPTPDEKFTPLRENAAISYGALAARELKADYVCIAWSGKKLWPNNSILDYYDRVLPKEQAASAWDFSSWTPDAVVINLGSNDFGVSDPDGPGWTAAYRDLIKRLRRQYPQAWIYPTLGTMLGDWPAPRKPASTVRGYLTALTKEFNEAGDTRVRFIDFGTQKRENGYGGSYHPSAKTHEVMAGQLVRNLRRDLGW